MAEQPGDKMTLNMKAELTSKPGSTGPEEFSMVVTVQGPPEIAKIPPPAVPGPGAGIDVDGKGRGVDLVAVLDISDNMTAEKLEDMKQAMYVVIRKLGEGDRLSIVSFNDGVEQVMQLTDLTKVNEAKVENREVARSIVEKLQAGGDAKVNGLDKESEAKLLAAKILEEREGEQKDRVGRVIFLSKGDDDTDAAQTKMIRHETKAESFLWGADGLTELTDGDAKRSIAVAAGKQSVEMMAPSIRGLKSVDTGKTAQIDVHALEGVEISCVESGSNGLSLNGTARKEITVVIPGLRAGEHKSFTVFLQVPEPSTTTDILYVSGWCKGDKDDVKFDEKFFNVMRTAPPSNEKSSSTEKKVTPAADVPNEKQPSTEKEVTPAAVDVPNKKNPSTGKKVTPAADVPNEKQPSTKKEVTPAVIDVPNKKHPSTGKKVTPAIEDVPEVGRDQPGWVTWLGLQKKPKKVETDQPRWGTWLLSLVQIIPDNFKKIKWSKTYSWALAVLLLGVGVAMLINSIPAPPPPPPSPSMPDLDISQHPDWPKMEESIALITLKKMDEARITSSLRGASIEEISSAVNRYIYQALVHDTGLHVSLLEETVQTLEAETEELRVNIETLAKEKAQKEEKKEAVERANATIADLERQLAGLLEEAT